MKNFAVILAAAGQSRRFLDKKRTFVESFSHKKPFVLINGRSVWLYSVDRFVKRQDVKQIILIVPEENREEIENKYSMDIAFHSIDLVNGGKERYESIENALKIVRNDIDFIAVHDAARPCITDAAIASVFEKAIQFEAAILAAPVVGTLKQVMEQSSTETSEIEMIQNRLRGFDSNSKEKTDCPNRRFIQQTISRQNLWEAQTPQVFKKDILLKAYKNRGDLQPTDDAQLIEKQGNQIFIVPSDRTNIKITSSDDLIIAEALLKKRSHKRTLFE